MLFLMRNPGRSLPLTLVLALAVLTIASVVALLNSIDRNEDSLRFYRLPGDRQQWVESYGRDAYVDFEEPIVI